MKLTLTQVSHFTKDKNDKPLITSKGLPYQRCLIKTEEYGSQVISGFGNPTTQAWKEGDSIEADVAEVKKDGKTFLNFSLPKKGNGGGMSEDQFNRIMAGQMIIREQLKVLLDLAMPKEEEPPMPNFE